MHKQKGLCQACTVTKTGCHLGESLKDEEMVQIGPQQSSGALLIFSATVVLYGEKKKIDMELEIDISLMFQTEKNTIITEYTTSLF